ncbi:hypothetical protein Lepto7375DRAFT_7255 [Leptolyngbya sp. PCC 7375]|nr:hypothetical protein Lepto7375DRAFT_7255 [Leptolyngbya sp. PCC 7375]
MGYQGTKTISRTVETLIDEFKSMGFDNIDANILRDMISESDVVGSRDTDVWVEASASQSADLEEHPHLVYCTLDLDKPNAITERIYRAV